MHVGPTVEQRRAPVETGLVKVLIVDDHPSFRGAARALLIAAGGFDPVGEAASGEEAVDLAVRLRPDLVILDLRLPGIDGRETCRRIAAAGVKTLVLFVSVDEEALTPVVGIPCAGPFVPKRSLNAPILRAIWAESGQTTVVGDREP
jgi:DNA-binding NarL/FixJ family response regulator